MGSLTLPNSGAVYLDANSVIYSVECVPPYDRLLLPVWTAAQSSTIQILTSELTWLETMVKPLRTADTYPEQRFRDILTNPVVELIPATIPLWEEAARIRSLGLKTPDALHAATALATRVALFVMNDSAFRRVPGLNVAVLHEHIP